MLPVDVKPHCQGNQGMKGEQGGAHARRGPGQRQMRAVWEWTGLLLLKSVQAEETQVQRSWGEECPTRLRSAQGQGDRCEASGAAGKL